MTAPLTISEGATRPTVKWAQYLLVRRPVSCNQLDGIFGPVTKTAVEEFQCDSHLPVDGVVGPATWAVLGDVGVQPPTLARGFRGPVVEKLQTALNEGRGDFAPELALVLAVDGIYGAQTATAVMGTQQLASIDDDGVAGLQTWTYPCTRPARCSRTWAVSRARRRMRQRATGHLVLRCTAFPVL
jgi:zinc D-Ala-D-Ala carboxypeptidase